MEILFNIIILLPLLSFILLGSYGRKIGTYGSMIISCINISISFILTIIIWINLGYTNILYNYMWTWLYNNEFGIAMATRYDSLTGIMFIIVTSISMSVHIYSTVYMYTDAHLSRFMSYLSLSTFFMLILVSADNLLVLFLGWEGVGLCSYLLIGFWYTRAQAAKAATNAFIINKIGDVLLLIGLGIIYVNINSLDFIIISTLITMLPEKIVNIISIFLFCGAIGKSAQIGLHSWLPKAMEGPTPVSALIHAATMVTAGVFLVIRCSFIFEMSPKILTIISICGGITAFISGTIGISQNDIKKIIAYSTCSQLGYMILSCGIGVYHIGAFHLFNHAFFKALLFLSAGSIIHILSNEQDIRRMGSIVKLSPFIYIQMIIASLSLAGFPFYSGFFSKDIIIEFTITKFWFSKIIYYWLVIISAILTTIYSLKLIENVFITNVNIQKFKILNISKITLIELIILGLLGILSVISGYFFKDIFNSLGLIQFAESIILSLKDESAIDLEYISFEIKIIPVLISILAFKYNIKLFEGKWLYDELLSKYIAIPILNLSRLSFDQIEKYKLENMILYIIKYKF